MSLVEFRKVFSRFLSQSVVALIASAGMLFALTGCDTTPTAPYEQLVPGEKAKPVQPEAIVLREGDVLKFDFLGAPTLNDTKQVRRDGKITFKLIGDVVVAGKTAKDLEQELIKLYADQIQLQQITITPESTFSVFVTGAVVSPGKVVCDRPTTALEAILERGGFNFQTANPKAVKITRNVNGKLEHYSLNLKAELDGDVSHPFYLKPQDIVYVPERFQIF